MYYKSLYRKSSIKPPRRGGGLFFQAHLRGLNRDRAYLRWGGSLLHLEKTIVSALHKELEYKVEKLKYRKVEHHAAEDQKRIRTSSW